MESLAELQKQFAVLTADHRVGEFSFEHGWVPLLRTLAEKIEQLDAVCREGFLIWQVKEKFGYLSVQGVAGPEIARLIDDAERASARTCAVCGDVGTLITRGWYRVLCLEHQTPTKNTGR